MLSRRWRLYMWRRKRPVLLSLLFGVVLSGLPGCANSPIVIDSFCQVADQIGAPMTYSGTKDTAETRGEIDRFNAAWLCICMKECPK